MGHRRWTLIPSASAVALTALAAALAAPEPASAHGLLLDKKDLPVPEWLFAWAASLVLIVSFVILTVAWRSTRFEGADWKPAPPALSRLVVNPVTEFAAGLISVCLLFAVVYTGFEGTLDPNRNFAVPFVLVTFWLGLVLLSVLFGDVFRALNPWRAIARAFAALVRLIAGQSPPPPLRYPDWLGRWPAVLGIFAFVWFELVYAVGLNSIGLRPEDVAVATLVYSAITFTAMALFGIDEWLDRGEAFSVYFGMFASLAVLEVRGGVLGFRRVLSGATTWVTHPGSLALILVSIGLTAYDGAQEGVLSEPILTSFDALRDLGLGGTASFRIVSSVFMLASVLFVSGLYWLGVVGMHTVPSRRSTRELARLFAHSFIPIALAYVVAHYLTLFLFIEQAQFGYLLSDPLGEGSDLFGTADNGIDYGLIGAEGVWYAQVAALVVGHVMALALGHDRALAVYEDARAAARSQYWMLALMVGFTSLGLFLLSQSNA